MRGEIFEERNYLRGEIIAGANYLQKKFGAEFGSHKRERAGFGELPHGRLLAIFHKEEVLAAEANLPSVRIA